MQHGHRQSGIRFPGAHTIVTPAVDRHSAAARQQLRDRHADLEDLLAQQVSLIEFAQGALVAEMTAGAGAARESISRDQVVKLREVTAALRAAGDTRINLAKAAKLLASTMTPDEVLAAARARIMAIPVEERGDYIERMLRDHRDAVRRAAAARETASEVVADALKEIP